MFEIWYVERFVNLGNTWFWHEVVSLDRTDKDSDARMADKCHRIGERDVTRHGGLYRIRVEKSEVIFEGEK